MMRLLKGRHEFQSGSEWMFGGWTALVVATLVAYMNLERRHLDMNFMSGACFLMHARGRLRFKVMAS